LIEIRGKIAKTLKFWDQLGVKLKIFAVKDQSAKGAGLYELNWQKPGVELNKIEILMVN